MRCTIKHITAERELDAALALDEKVFGVPSERGSPAYAREKWLERMKDAGDLMLYVESEGEVIGIVFGRIEDDRSITVGPVAVYARFRGHGIARALMLTLETRALGHGIRRLALGAAESAEGFYLKLGYTGTLLVQSEKHSIDELLSLNTQYRVMHTNVYDGTVQQIYLDLPAPDRALQRRYERTLPGCHTQMVFGKTIGTEDSKMTNDIGNYARHARYWDWGGHDRTDEYAYWHGCAKRYGNNVLIPMCAWGETGAHMAERGMSVTALDITPEMIEEGRKRFGDVPGLRFLLGDVRDFRIDMQPADFCYCVDFEHIHTVEEIQKALVCINNHLRDGGGLIIEAWLPGKTSKYVPTETFFPLKQMYPGLKVWKTGETRIDAATGRRYISQIFYAQDESGHIEHFDHSFYLQSYTREAWLAALK
ncbi:MAG TPA: bifunctional GNAT family N-acetyltransferase/class I SAM-dependent methyltransferase, partial [Clostridia bacterium]|nr:bifunctional GNAT family N-acetyltransferase/class I SAM-dependent methyltransferase [Clostridia bacterium]